MQKEYKTITEIAGPLMMLNKVTDVSMGELGEIMAADGS